METSFLIHTKEFRKVLGKKIWSVAVLKMTSRHPWPWKVLSRTRYHLRRTCGKMRKPQTEYLNTLPQSKYVADASVAGLQKDPLPL